MREMLSVNDYFRVFAHLVRHPVGSLRYGYLYAQESRVNRETKISQLLGTTPEVAHQYLAELRNSLLIEELRNSIRKAGRLPAAGMTAGSRGQVLYAICRILRPLVVVETGVSSGVSSSYILEALYKNGSGRLHSIDYPDEYSPPVTGWLIPDRLRESWTLTAGKSSERLEPVLQKEGKVDIFLHDSDHSYENMMFEFHKAWPCIREGGLLLSDDINMNKSFCDFATEVNREGVKFYALGGIRK